MSSFVINVHIEEELFIYLCCSFRFGQLWTTLKYLLHECSFLIWKITICGREVFRVCVPFKVVNQLYKRLAILSIFSFISDSGHTSSIAIPYFITQPLSIMPVGMTTIIRYCANIIYTIGSLSRNHVSVTTYASIPQQKIITPICKFNRTT